VSAPRYVLVIDDAVITASSVPDVDGTERLLAYARRVRPRWQVRRRWLVRCGDDRRAVASVSRRWVAEQMVRDLAEVELARGES